MIGPAQNAIQPIEIGDLIEGLAACATRTGIEGEVYTFAGPAAMTVEEMFRLAAAAMNVAPPRLRIPMLPARFAAWLFEAAYPVWKRKPPIDSNKLEIFRANHAYTLSRAREDLNWVPTTPFEEGAKRVAAVLRERGLRP